MICCSLALLVSTSSVYAVSVSELSEQVARAVQGGMSEEQEQSLIGALADVSVEVANRYDNWVRTGSAEARQSAAALADALLPVLERLHDHHQRRLDKAQNDVIAADGNPEVLYDQKPWQLDRGFALATQGQLDWLYYRSAMLHPEAKETNKARLKRAVEGFSEFVYAQDRRMQEESLLGRALAEKELGEYDAAAGDLKAVIDRGKESPLYWPARITLAQVKIASGDAGAMLAETQRLIADASGGGVPSETVNQMRLLRFEALATATKKGGNESLKREAVALSRQLSGLGAVWSRRVHEIALASMSDPRELLGATASAEWIAAENLASEEKFKEAVPAYEAVLRSTDPAAREHATDAHHRLGVCYFRLGRYADAERELRTFLNAAPRSALAPEAAYLRFRAAEGVYREHPTADTRELFVSAVESFVKDYPGQENAHEGWFRLGEILQGERRSMEAADAYAKVKGPAVFQVRATAGEVQSLADVLANPPEKAAKAWAEPLRARAEKAYERFVEVAGRSDAKGAATAELRARTTLAKAMAESGGPGARFTDALATLRDFESRYPGEKDLFVLAGALRLASLGALNKYDEAARSLDAWLAAVDPREASDLLEKVGRSFIRVSADNAGANQQASDRWIALSAKVYDKLRAAGFGVAADVRANLAAYYTQQGRFDDAAALYRELVKESPKSKMVLRNAAMVADKRGAAAEAAEYWNELATMQETASPSWYEARLQAAQDWMAAGQTDKSCSSLREVDDFHPDLRDAPTKKKYEELTSKACKAAKL